uniref:70 kDa subunit of replication protein A n=1 Tax=Solanum tuberosum TaxID=4113 RepID=M1DEA2_SOLTU
MISLEELKNQCLPISKLKKYATKWVIKVLVIRRSLIKEYKNANSEGIRWQLILVDKEGTKIQTTLFNKDVHAWNKSFQLNQSYYIINGKLNGAKPNFLSVHNDLELAFMNNTEVVEDKYKFKTEQFSNGFTSFDEAEKITNGSLFVKALTGEGRSIRREVIVTNERYDRKVMTLWGDFAEIEGQMLQSLESDKPVLAFCDVKSSIYQGDFVLSTTPVSSLLINPQFEKENNLQEWNDNMKAQKIDLSLMPSRLMQTVRQVKITNILNGSLAIVKDMYYKFNATVSGIDNSTDPWYHACKKCYMKVTVIKSSATCTYCRAEDIDYEKRYRLKIDVTAEDQFLRITLFDAAKYYFGCEVKDYVLSTSEKKEESEYYRKY